MDGFAIALSTAMGASRPEGSVASQTPPSITTTASSATQDAEIVVGLLISGIVLGEAFNRVAQTLEDETLVLSSPNQMLKHPNVAKVMSFSRPYVISKAAERLEEHPVLWISILREVTASDPVPDEERGKIPLMINRWRDWAAQHGADAEREALV